MRVLIELSVIILLIPFISLSTHEMTHYYVVTRWVDDVSIGFQFILPGVVLVDDLSQLSDRQLRLFCGAPTAVWGGIFGVLLALQAPLLNFHQITIYILLFFAAFPSPADLFGVFYPSGFKKEADEELFGNIAALKHLFQYTF
jgi:hypothetical protein